MCTKILTFSAIDLGWIQSLKNGYQKYWENSIFITIQSIQILENTRVKNDPALFCGMMLVATG